MFQQCLRHLTLVMIDKFAAPADLETVVREIWLLYISHSQLHYQSRREVDRTKTGIKSSSVPDEDLDMLEDENEENRIVAELENSDNVVNEEVIVSFERAMNSNNYGSRFFSKWPVLVYRDLLVFIYLGCVWLRWPILLSDLQRWTVVGKIPFVKLTKDLPTDIFDVIAYQKLHFIKTVPNMPTLYYFTRRWMGCFRVLANLTFPDSNYVPIVHRGLREMMLPGRVTDSM